MTLPAIRALIAALTVLALSGGALADRHAPRVEIEDLAVGDGDEAIFHAGVMIHYVGRLADGTTFDTTQKSMRPFQFTIGDNRVIPGMEQGVTGMRAGGRRRITIPPELGYGDKGAPPSVPPGATLTFDISLINVFPPRYENIGLDEMKRLRARAVTIVDIRTPREWEATGTIPGSHLLSAVNEKGRLNTLFLAKLKKIAGENEMVIFVGWDGFRSRKMAHMLSRFAGYSGIFNFEPGLKAWIESGGKVEK